MPILRINSPQINVDRVEQSSSNSQSRPCPNLLDEAERGEAQAIVNVLNLSQNTISDMESGIGILSRYRYHKTNLNIFAVTDHCCGCEGRQSPCPGGESSKMPQRRLTSAKSLFTFDNSRSKAGLKKVSFLDQFNTHSTRKKKRFLTFLLVFSV